LVIAKVREKQTEQENRMLKINSKEVSSVSRSTREKFLMGLHFSRTEDLEKVVKLTSIKIWEVSVLV
jgi:hypothetical protein